MHRIKATFSVDFIKQVKLGILICDQHVSLINPVIDALIARLSALGQPEHHLQIIHAPNYEALPFLCKALARQGEIDGLIIAGIAISTDMLTLPLTTLKEACEGIALAENMPLGFLLLNYDDEITANDSLNQYGHELAIKTIDQLLALTSILSQL